MRSPPIGLMLLMTALPIPVLAEAQAEVPAAPRHGPGWSSCVLHPTPECRHFGVTEIGLARGPALPQRSPFDLEEGTTEFLAQGGVMRNFAAGNAVGLTWFFGTDSAAVFTGPGARYRYWISDRQSLDASVGLLLASNEYERGSVFGSITYSPVQWIGFAVRPERIRRMWRECVPGACHDAFGNDSRLLVGVHLSGKPGAVAGLALGASAALYAILASAML